MPSRRSYRKHRHDSSDDFIFWFIKLIFLAAFGVALWIIKAIAHAIVDWKRQKTKEAAERENASVGMEKEETKDEKSSHAEDRREVDELILRGQQMLYQIRVENERLPDSEISAQIDDIESIANQIFKTQTKFAALWITTCPQRSKCCPPIAVWKKAT